MEGDNEAMAEQDPEIFEPNLLSSHDHRIGNVNEIEFLTSEVFAVASSDGTVTVLKIDRDSISRFENSTGYKLNVVAKWSQLLVPVAPFAPAAPTY